MTESGRAVLVTPGSNRFSLGAYPLWWDGALWLTDLPENGLYRVDPVAGEASDWPTRDAVGAIAPCAEGGLVVARRRGLWRFNPDSTPPWIRLAGAPYDTARYQFNAGSADPQGRLWLGTYSASEADGSLYRFMGRRLQRMADGAGATNGVVFSPDGRTFYWSDTRGHAIHAHGYDPVAGRLTDWRVFASFPKRNEVRDPGEYRGRPDGLAVNGDGDVWVAMLDGGRILRFGPDGTEREEIRLPVSRPTAVCLGGDDWRTMFVTTASQGLLRDEPDRHPMAGHVLQMRVEVSGLPAHPVRLR